MSAQFHRLRIAQVRSETADAISVRFDVPDHLREAYAFTHGQHLGLRAMLNGSEVRRSYSICASAQSGELRIAIKRVAGGQFSQWALATLREGERIDVLTPQGGFHTALDPAHRLHYVAFAAGSGITPILSILSTTLDAEPHSRCTLVYCNRRTVDALFQEELQDLKDRHLARFALYNVFSQEPQDVELYCGRLDRTRVERFLDTLVPPSEIDHAFVCGPGSMIDEVEAALTGRGVPPACLHSERFGIPVAAYPDAPRNVAHAHAQITLILDGRRHAVAMLPTDGSILDAAIRSGLDLPYSCRGGMCCTCRAKVLDGKLSMRRNFGLEPHDIAAGYVLTCQGVPTTPAVTISFDER